MTFPATIDTDSLLTPLEPGGVGEFLDPSSRDNPIVQLEFGPYRKLINWEDDRVDGLWGRATPKPVEGASWEELATRSEEIIGTRSKDLLALRMLIVAMAYQHGVAGIRDGLSLLKGMLDSFGTSLHPQPSPAESLEPSKLAKQISTAFNPLKTLPDLLSAALRIAPLTDASSDPVSRLRCEIAAFCHERGRTLTDDQKAHFRKTAILKPAIDEQFQQCDLEYLTELSETLRECQELCKETQSTLKSLLYAILERKDVDRDFGSFQKLVEEIENCLRITDEALRKRADKEAVSSESPEPDADPIPNDSTQPSPQSVGNVTMQENIGAGLRTRKQAIEAMQSIQEFFRQSEPHSPIPGILDRAIHWAGLSFEEVIAEILEGQSNAMTVFKDRANLKIENDKKPPRNEPPQSSEAKSNAASDAVEEKTSDSKEEIDPFGG